MVWRFRQIQSWKAVPHDSKIVSKENSNELLKLIDRIIGNNNAKDNKKNNDTKRNLDQLVDNNNQFQINTNNIIP